MGRVHFYLSGEQARINTMAILPRWSGRAWAWIVATAVFISGVVGFLASSTDLFEFVTTPRNDINVLMLPDAKTTLAYDAKHPADNLPTVLRAGTIVIDDITLDLPEGGVVITN